MQNLIIDNAGIRVIDSAVSTDQELGDLGFLGLSVGCEEFTELGVRLKDVGDTLGGIETGDLDDILAAWPPKLVHLLLDAHTPELAHVELSIPDAKFLVQTIKPISGSTQESKSLNGDIVWDEVAHGMTNEKVCMLDVVPEVFPDFLLRGPLLVDKVATDLDVRAIDDRKLWTGLLDQRDQARHLGVVYNGV